MWDDRVPLGFLGVFVVLRAFLRAARGYKPLKNVLVYRQGLLDSRLRQRRGVTAQRTHYPGFGALCGPRERHQAALAKRVFAAQLSRTPPTEVVSSVANPALRLCKHVVLLMVCFSLVVNS